MKSGKAKTGFLAGILVLLFIAVPAMAEQKEANPINASQKFNIESGSLEDVLDSYSKVTGIKTVYLNDLVAGKKSPGVQGIYSPEAAVKKILKGTGLTYQVTAENTVVLKENEMVVAQREAEEKEEVKRPLEMEQMVVTAQKREENVQDVPASISVFSDIQIEDADIRDTVELTRFTPNVHIKTSGPEHPLVFRGITTFDTSIYSAAGFYVDDVNYPLHYMYNPDFFDIERIEVLKGPQGTLYGRNTESGVINIITKQPDNKLQGKIFGEYENYTNGDFDGYRTGGSVSGPIVRDKLYLRLAGQWEDSDGFLKNEYNDDDEAGKIEHLNGRGTLRWTPTDKWDISFIADAMDTNDNLGVYRFLTGPSKTDRHKINWDGDYYSDQEGNGQTLRIKYEGDSFNVLSVTGRRYYEHDLALDADCSAVPPPYSRGSTYLNYESETISEEIRVSSPNVSGPFKWLLGIYGYWEDTDVDVARPVMGLFPTTDMDVNGFATFGQGTYTLFGRLHLTAGLRYDYVDLEGDFKKPANFMDPVDRDYDKGLNDGTLLPRFSLAFDLTDDIMTYASASRGYLTGGYNYGLAGDIESFYYDPEYTWNYEVGIKTAWLDRRLMANLSAFYIDIKDKQVMETVMSNPMIQEVKNAAEAHSMGVELELQARPMRGLDFFAGFGYTEAEFDDWTATEFNMATSQFEKYDYEDKDLPNAPEYTYNLGVQYRHEFGFFGRVDLLGTGSFYGDSKNKAKEDNYELVNLRLGYEREHFDIVCWCKNLFDERYETSKHVWGPNELGQDGEPRMFGVTVTCRF